MEESDDKLEDTAIQIQERINRVDSFLHNEQRRRRCYAAAMSRLWGVPAAQFATMARGPKVLDLKGRGYVYRTRAENEGVPTLLELCLDVIDSCYEKMGSLLAPESCWQEAAVQIPTAWEQNGQLCLVCTKKQRV